MGLTDNQLFAQHREELSSRWFARVRRQKTAVRVIQGVSQNPVLGWSRKFYDFFNSKQVRWWWMTVDGRKSESFRGVIEMSKILMIELTEHTFRRHWLRQGSISRRLHTHHIVPALDHQEHEGGLGQSFDKSPIRIQVSRFEISIQTSVRVDFHLSSLHSLRKFLALIESSAP